MIYALQIGWCALESVDTEIKHLDNWLIDWLIVKYYLTFVVLISSEDLVTNISPTYNLSFYFWNLNIIYLFFYLNVTSFLYLIMHW